MRGFHLRTGDEATARVESHLQTVGLASARGALTCGLEAGPLREGLSPADWRPVLCVRALTCGLEAGPLQEKVLCYGDHLAFPLLIVSENLHISRFCRVY